MQKKQQVRIIYAPWLLNMIICIGLATMTLLTYWQVKDFAFVNYDDTLYILENPHVQEGLNFESLSWSFTTNRGGNWHPLVWMSFLIEIHFFGLNPTVFHITNVFLHILNTLLLYLLLWVMTNKSWRSAFVAAMFALHPLHVESVAWISERKDVLSTFFWLLTMLSYAWYVKRPYYIDNSCIFRYMMIILCFFCGIMSKAMLVTLPFVLLLLDFWPLKRFQLAKSSANEKNQDATVIYTLLWEKAPLFILMIAASIAAYISQSQSHTLATIHNLPLFERFSNATISYIRYLIKMIWPMNLAVLYPLTGKVVQWQFWGSALILFIISLSAVKTALKLPFFIVGWLWYLGTLVPVIGIVQIGSQSFADRYTYVPLIGIFIIIAWGVPILFTNKQFGKILFALLGTSVLLFFSIKTYFQLPIWQDSIKLWENTINVTSDNAIAHYNLGIAMEKKDHLVQAIEHYSEAIRLKPESERYHRSMARALNLKGETDKAIEHYIRSLEINPNSVISHYEMGIILAEQGRLDGALYHLEEVIKTNPDYKDIKIQLDKVKAKFEHSGVFPNNEKGLLKRSNEKN